MTPEWKTQFDSLAHDGTIRNELGDSKYFYGNWPVRTIEGPIPYGLSYQAKYLEPIEYWTPRIQIHTPTPMSDIEMTIEKLRNSIQEHFGICGLPSEADKVKIGESQEAPISIHRGRIIERVE